MKKGFTIIEVLSIIVIISVIALITIPIVSNILFDIEKKSYKSSAKGIVNSMENKLANEKFKKLPIIYEIDENRITEIDSDMFNELEYEGKIDSNGYMYMNAYESTGIYISNKKFCAYKDINDKDISVSIVDSAECEEAKSLIDKWKNENGIWDDVTDLEVEINASILIPKIKAYDSEGDELESTYTVTNITSNSYIGRDIYELSSQYTSKLNDVFEVEYKAFDNSINKEIIKVIKIKVVDRTAPVFTVATIKSSTSGYNSNKILVSVSATDNSNDSLMMYITNGEGITKEDKGWVQLMNTTEKILSNSLDGSSHNVLIQIKDKSGNIAEQRLEPYVIYKECNNIVSNGTTYGTCSSSCSRTVTYNYKDKYTSKTCPSVSGGLQSCSGGNCVTCRYTEVCTSWDEWCISSCTGDNDCSGNMECGRTCRQSEWKKICS